MTQTRAESAARRKLKSYWSEERRRRIGLSGYRQFFQGGERYGVVNGRGSVETFFLLQ